MLILGNAGSGKSVFILRQFKILNDKLSKAPNEACIYVKLNEFSRNYSDQ